MDGAVLLYLFAGRTCMCAHGIPECRNTQQQGHFETLYFLERLFRNGQIVEAQHQYQRKRLGGHQRYPDSYTPAIIDVRI